MVASSSSTKALVIPLRLCLHPLANPAFHLHMSRCSSSITTTVSSFLLPVRFSLLASPRPSARLPSSRTRSAVCLLLAQPLSARHARPSRFSVCTVIWAATPSTPRTLLPGLLTCSKSNRPSERPICPKRALSSTPRDALPSSTSRTLGMPWSKPTRWAGRTAWTSRRSLRRRNWWNVNNGRVRN